MARTSPPDGSFLFWRSSDVQLCSLAVIVHVVRSFRERDDTSHGLLRDYLRVGPEAGGAVEAVREVRPRVGRDVSFPGDTEEVHVLESADDLVRGEVHPAPVDLPCEILVHDQREEAGEEVSRDTVVPPQEHGPGLEVGLRDAEAVLDYPASSVHPDDFRGVVLQVGADSVEAVEAGLLVYHLLIERIAAALRELSVGGAALVPDEAPRVVLPLAEPARRSVPHDAFRPGNLLVPDMPEVVAVLEREGHDEPLLQFLPCPADFHLYPTLSAEQPVGIHLGIQFRQVIFLLGQPRPVLSAELHRPPSVRPQGPVLEVALQLLQRLHRDKCPLPGMVVHPVLV